MGEDIQGPWLDKRTGKTIYVDDIIMDGDTMLVRTSLGLLDGNTFGQFFIKMSEEDYGTAGITPELTGKEMNAAINQGIDEGLRIEQVKPKLQETQQEIKSSTMVETKETPKQKNNQTKSVNYSLIEKVFTKMETEPQIEFNVNLDEWPVKELKMLINILDVSFDEISDYIITNYLNKETLTKCFSEYLQNALENDK